MGRLGCGGGGGGLSLLRWFFGKCFGIGVRIKKILKNRAYDIERKQGYNVGRNEMKSFLSVLVT